MRGEERREGREERRIKTKWHTIRGDNTIRIQQEYNKKSSYLSYRTSSDSLSRPEEHGRVRYKIYQTVCVCGGLYMCQICFMYVLRMY